MVSSRKLFLKPQGDMETDNFGGWLAEAIALGTWDWVSGIWVFLHEDFVVVWLLCV